MSCWKAPGLPDFKFDFDFNPTFNFNLGNSAGFNLPSFPKFELPTINISCSVSVPTEKADSMLSYDMAAATATQQINKLPPSTKTKMAADPEYRKQVLEKISNNAKIEAQKTLAERQSPNTSEISAQSALNKLS